MGLIISWSCTKPLFFPIATDGNVVVMSSVPIFLSTQALCKFWSKQLRLMDPPVFLICLPPQLLSFCMICSVVCRSARNNLRSLSFSLNNIACAYIRLVSEGLTIKIHSMFSVCYWMAAWQASPLPLLQGAKGFVISLPSLSFSPTLMLPNKSTRGFISLIMLTGLPP